MATSLLYQKGKTLKKVSKEQALKTAAFVAVFGITGIVAYAATRAYKSIMDIGDFDGDLSNDSGLSQMMGERDE
jgi:hypothetical protein